MGKRRANRKKNKMKEKTGHDKNGEKKMMKAKIKKNPKVKKKSKAKENERKEEKKRAEDETFDDNGSDSSIHMPPDSIYMPQDSSGNTGTLVKVTCLANILLLGGAVTLYLLKPSCAVEHTTLSFIETTRWEPANTTTTTTTKSMTLPAVANLTRIKEDYILNNPKFPCGKTGQTASLGTTTWNKRHVWPWLVSFVKKTPLKNVFMHFVKPQTHPLESNTRSLTRDVTLSTLATELKMDRRIDATCLPTANLKPHDRNVQSKGCYGMGWAEVGILKQRRLKLIPHSECKKLFGAGATAPSTTFCAKGKDYYHQSIEKDYCMVDRGGSGMVCDNEGDWTLYGVMSDNAKCGTKQNLLTQMSFFVNWLCCYMKEIESCSTEKNMCDYIFDETMAHTLTTYIK